MEEDRSLEFGSSGDLVIDTMPSGESELSQEVLNSKPNSPLMSSEDPVMTVASNLSDNSEFGEGSVLIPIKENIQDTINTSDTFEIAASSKIEGNSFSSTSDLSSLPDLVSPNPSSPTLSDLIKENTTPCSVVLKRLTKEEIEKYISYSGLNSQKEAYIRSSLKKNSQRENYHDKFSEYRKNRKNFFQKKKRRYSSDKEDSNTSNDEYKPSDFYTAKERRKRKKKLAYEEDIDWRPNLDRDDTLAWKPPSKHKKSEKLRITTRRRRIETDSDSDSDFDYETYMYDYDEEEEEPVTSKKSEESNHIATENIYDPFEPESIPKKKPTKAKAPKSSTKKSENMPQDTMIDNDVLSRIMQEMEDYNMKNRKGSQIVKTIFNGSKRQTSISKTAKNDPPKRKRTGIKVTKDVLPPVVTTVQKLVSNMVNTVCSVENARLEEVDTGKKRKCKWCEVLFQSENEKDILCVICKDTLGVNTLQGLTSSKKSKSKKSSNVKGTNVVKINPKNKIKSKVLKNLSKYEQQRLIYGESVADKGFNHCKSFSQTDEPIHQASDFGKVNKKAVKKKKKPEAQLKENKKTSKSSKASQKKSTVNDFVPGVPKQKQSQASFPMVRSNNNSSLQNVKSKNNIEFANVNKGLFKMNFPDPDKEIEIPKISKVTASPSKASPTIIATVTQSTSTPSTSLQSGANAPTTSNQYGTFVIPSVPTVVVANYASPNTSSGNYVLSSVFYQNEITKKTAVSNTNVVKAVTNSPLSMPTINDFAKVHQPPPLYQNAVLSMQSNYMSQRPPLSNIPGNSILIPNKNIRNVQPNQPSVIQSNPNHLQVSQNLIIRGSNPPLISNSFSGRPDISRLISECGLQITPAVLGNSIANSIRPSHMPLVNQFNPATESNISRLVNNYGLQITTAPIQNQQLNNSVINNSANLTCNINNSSDKFGVVGSDLGLQITPSLEVTSLQSKNPEESLSLLNNSIEANITQKSQIMSNNSNDFSIAQNNVDHQQNEKQNKIVEKQTLPKIDSSLEREYFELEAFTVLSIIDLEKHPKNVLNSKIDLNDKEVEETSKDKNQRSKHRFALNKREILQIAKKWLSKYGTFARLSESFLKDETQPLKTPIQIKKEHIEQEEEEMSSCQFSDAASITSRLPNPSEFTTTINANVENMSTLGMNPESFADVNHIANLAVQVDSIADQLKSAGVDCTIPIPGITAMPSQGMLIPPNVPRNDYMLESRETPSRGSGPRTPARPESASSHVDERTPAQIKKERLETVDSPFSQCAFSGTNPSISQPSMSITPLQSITSSVSQSLGNLPPAGSPSFSHMLTPTTLCQGNSVQSNLPQVVLPQGMIYSNQSVMSRQSTSTPNSSLMPSISYSNTISNQSSSVSIRTIPQGANAANLIGTSRYGGSPNVVISNANYSNNMPRIQNVSYQNQVPPNRTVPFNLDQNMSKVLMNLSSNSSSQNSPGMTPNNSNVIVRNQHGQQVYMQHQSGNQLYNVQQVYLPNTKPSILQQTLNTQQNRAIPQSTNQYVMRQVQNTVTNTLAGGSVMVNSASVARNSAQLNMYPIQNNVGGYPQDQAAQSLDSTVVQQITSPNTQATPNSPATFLMQNNNNKVYFFEIMRPG